MLAACYVRGFTMTAYESTSVKRVKLKSWHDSSCGIHFQVIYLEAVFVTVLKVMHSTCNDAGEIYKLNFTVRASWIKGLLFLSTEVAI